MTELMNRARRAAVAPGRRICDLAELAWRSPVGWAAFLLLCVAASVIEGAAR